MPRVSLDSPKVYSVPQERGQISPPETVKGVLLALLDLPATITSAAIQSGIVRHPLQRSQELCVRLMVLCTKYKGLPLPAVLPCSQLRQQIVGYWDLALLPSFREESPLLLGLDPECLVGPIDVAELKVHHLLVTQTTFHAKQDAKAHVRVRCCQQSPCLLGRIHRW